MTSTSRTRSSRAWKRAVSPASSRASQPPTRRTSGAWSAAPPSWTTSMNCFGESANGDAASAAPLTKSAEHGMVCRRVRGKAAEQALGLVLDARGEENAVGIASRAAIARGECPKIADNDRLSVRPQKLPCEMVVLEVERINRAVSEIPNQQVPSEPAEAVRCDCQPPWRIQRSIRRYSLHHSPGQVEFIDEAVTCSRN